MHTILFFLLLHVSLIVAARQNLQVSPLFQRVISHAGDKIYVTKAWSVYTGAPVRATPLVNGQYIYFGNANGDFFAIDKKNGR